MELQLYTNNTTRCLGIVVTYSEKKQDHQFNTIIKCYTFLQVNYLQIKTTFNKPLTFTNISEHYSRSTQYFFLNTSHSTDFATRIKDIVSVFKAYVKEFKTKWHTLPL